MAPCPAIGDQPPSIAKASRVPDQDRHDRQSLDLDHLRQWIGRSTEASDIVTAQLVKGLRATLVHGDRRAEAGRCRAVHRALVPGAAGFPMSELGPDGHPTRGGFLPPVPLPRRMWAGGELEFFEPLRVGDDGDAHLAHHRT